MPSKKKGAKLNARQLRQVKRIVGATVEDKYKDSEILTSVSATGATYQLSNPTQGVGVDQRTGDRIRLKKLEFRINALGADLSNTMRVIVWRYSGDTAGGLPSLTNLLAPGVSSLVYNCESMYQYEFMKQGQAHIVYDRAFTIDFQGTDAILYHKIRFGRKLGRQYLEYAPGATTGTDQFLVSVLSDSSAATHPTLHFVSRLTFEDA